MLQYFVQCISTFVASCQPASDVLYGANQRVGAVIVRILASRHLLLVRFTITQNVRSFAISLVHTQWHRKDILKDAADYRVNLSHSNRVDLPPYRVNIRPRSRNITAEWVEIIGRIGTLLSCRVAILRSTPEETCHGLI